MNHQTGLLSYWITNRHECKIFEVKDTYPRLWVGWLLCRYQLGSQPLGHRWPHRQHCIVGFWGSLCHQGPPAGGADQAPLLCPLWSRRGWGGAHPLPYTQWTLPHPPRLWSSQGSWLCWVGLQNREKEDAELFDFKHIKHSIKFIQFFMLFHEFSLKNIKTWCSKLRVINV